ncbi:MAG: hypothetical protein ACOYYS_28300 [Chloroflexota bacterium]
MFCAAIPAAVAVGAAAGSRQRAAGERQDSDGQRAETREKAKPKIPAGPATAVVVAGLVAGSVIYHTHF